MPSSHKFVKNGTCAPFVIVNLSVFIQTPPPYQAGTRSRATPDLVRLILICTFADVEECQLTIVLKLGTRYPNGCGQKPMSNQNFYRNMAKSKSGGTRSMIRGRVGSDVYSIGKNALGKKQQIVRSLAETVANPQTIAQMRGRMIMSTVMQAQSALKPIIDHSFDNVVGVQPNLSEFIKRNYALVKADVAANPSSSNAFGLNAYQEKGAKQGAYVISDGKAAVPAAITLTKASGIMVIALTAGTMTMAGLKAALSFGAEDYVTLVGIDTTGAAEYVRLHINQALSDETAISASNIASVFELGGNATPTIEVDGNSIKVTLAAVANCCAFIITRKQNDGFIHSKATLGAGTGLSWNADAALPTYPIGENKFLNGGDQSFNPAPTPTPPAGPVLTISVGSDYQDPSITVGGEEIESGDEVAGGSTIHVASQFNGFNVTPVIKIGDNTVNLTYSDGKYQGDITMPNEDATLQLTSVSQ